MSADPLRAAIVTGADRTGQTLTAGDLARSYGFTDVDGTQPKPFALY